VEIEPGEGGAIVAATYTIASQANSTPQSGAIGFHLTTSGERLLIDAISITPAR
jgi:hypothetical protein